MQDASLLLSSFFVLRFILYRVFPLSTTAGCQKKEKQQKLQKALHEDESECIAVFLFDAQLSRRFGFSFTIRGNFNALSLQTNGSFLPLFFVA